jgi:hypothetical protein
MSPRIGEEMNTYAEKQGYDGEIARELLEILDGTAEKK